MALEVSSLADKWRDSWINGDINVVLVEKVERSGIRTFLAALRHSGLGENLSCDLIHLSAPGAGWPCEQCRTPGMLPVTTGITSPLDRSEPKSKQATRDLGLTSSFSVSARKRDDKQVQQVASNLLWEELYLIQTPPGSHMEETASAWDPFSRKLVTQKRPLPSNKAAPVRTGGWSAHVSSTEERKMIWEQLGWEQYFRHG